MKCLYCKTKLPKYEPKCPKCGRFVPVNEPFSLGKINELLIVTAIFQIVVLAVRLYF